MEKQTIMNINSKSGGNSMSSILDIGQPVIFMKVGTHAKEELSDIIARKRKEIDDAGYALWGYGGNTCHPQTMVQPFARDYVRQGRKIYLIMHPMHSNHFADPVRADEYSVDANKWIKIPSSINVVGSRYALVIRDLRDESFELPLYMTKVAIGNSIGASGADYVKGRVDKACLKVTETKGELRIEQEETISIGLVAELTEPYAVYVRNRPS
jgi:hypothetical protein